MSAQEDFKIALNILARVGISGDVIGEFAKAKAQLHMMDSANQLNAQNLLPSALTQPPQPQTPQGGTMEPQIMSNPQNAPTGAFGG